MNKLLSSVKYVVENAEHVSISESAIKRYA